MLLVQKWIRAKLRRLLPIVMVFAVMVGGIATGAVPAHASGTYNNANIATDALADMGADPAPGGGQCKAFANAMVNQASGGTQSPSGYQSGWAAAGGTQVDPANAVEGDIIQITPAGSDDQTAESIYDAHLNADGSSPPAYHLHTAIIVSNNGNDSFTVVDANFTATNTVGKHTFDPYTWANGSIIDIWRMGTASQSTYKAAFQANGVNDLYTFDSNYVTSPTNLGMASGTSPATTAVAAGYESAFQANGTGNLYLYGDASTGDTGQGMMAGTSPAIAAASNSNSFEAAFQGNNGYLYTYQQTSSGDVVTQTTWGMWPGSSPAIAVLNNGQYEIAFMAAGSGNLYVWGPDGIINTGQGMASGTSPSIGGGSGGGYVVSFQANNGYLYFFDSRHVTSPTNLGMASGTSPATCAPPSGGYETVFQALGTDYLYIYGDYGKVSTNQGLMPGTSPAITGLSGGFEAAFAANGSGDLFVYGSSTGNALDTGQGLASGTSPSIG